MYRLLYMKNFTGGSCYLLSPIFFFIICSMSKSVVSPQFVDLLSLQDIKRHCK